MCGRISLSYSEAQELADELGVPSDQFRGTYRQRFNIAPTDPHWIVRVKYEEREILPARWGLVNSWAKDAKGAARQINARAETLESRGAFREAFKERRCLVPADGFFEWTGPKEARQPLWFHRPDGKPLLMAGLYEYWRHPEGEWWRTFAIVTTSANRLMEPHHDRMPVILEGEDADRWLQPREPAESLRPLLAPAPEESLVIRRVSSRVGSVKNDDAAVLEPLPEPARLL
jgi:putative SOS response-associated peptidase YedK